MRYLERCDLCLPSRKSLWQISCSCIYPRVAAASALSVLCSWAPSVRSPLTVLLCLQAPGSDYCLRWPRVLQPLSTQVTELSPPLTPHTRNCIRRLCAAREPCLTSEPFAGDASARASDYAGGITFKLLVGVVIAATGGMLFGYDLGVTGKQHLW